MAAVLRWQSQAPFHRHLRSSAQDSTSSDAIVPARDGNVPEKQDLPNLDAHVEASRPFCLPLPGPAASRQHAARCVCRCSPQYVELGKDSMNHVGPATDACRLTALTSVAALGLRAETSQC